MITRANLRFFSLIRMLHMVKKAEFKKKVHPTLWNTLKQVLWEVHIVCFRLLVFEGHREMSEALPD